MNAYLLTRLQQAQETAAERWQAADIAAKMAIADEREAYENLQNLNNAIAAVNQLTHRNVTLTDD